LPVFGGQVQIARVGYIFDEFVMAPENVGSTANIFVEAEQDRWFLAV
jgi:hypothetical protein